MKWKTALFKGIISTSHNQQSKYQTTNCKKLSTKSSAEQEVGNRKGGNPQQITNAWTKPCVPSMNEFPVALSANLTKRKFSEISANQYQPSSKPQTQHQQNKDEQMDDVLETINIASIGATSLLWKMSTGNTRLVPALKK